VGLSIPQMAVMGRLLDEALRRALFPAAEEAAALASISSLPDLEPASTLGDGARYHLRTAEVPRARLGSVVGREE
jgi:hypothetical protein